jgi:hypothetical protein
MEIPDPPTTQGCAGCSKPLRWYWSATSGQWVAFMPGDDRKPVLHGCRPLQAPGTWRALDAVPDPGQADINSAGRAAVDAALNNKISSDNEESQ